MQLVSPHLTHRVRARKRKCWFQTSCMGHIFQQKLRQNSQKPMDLKGRQKANASTCLAKDTSGSLSWESKHTRDSVVVFTRTVGIPEELGKEKSSLAGAGFHRSYFEFPQPAGAQGRLIFHRSASWRIIYTPQVDVKTLQTLTAPFSTHFAEVLMSKQSIRS